MVKKKDITNKIIKTGQSVKYHNEFNRMPLHNLSASELDVLIACFAILNDKKGNQVTVTYQKLRDLAGITNRSHDRIEQYMINLYTKLNQTVVKVEKESGVYKYFSIFDEFLINTNTNEVTIRMKEEYQYLVNNLYRSFTVFSCREFTSLSSVKTKRLYALLKQFRTTGIVLISKEEFNLVLNIPESFDTRKTTQRVIKPAVEELSKYFKDLRWEPIKKGRSYVAYRFLFNPEEVKSDQIVEIMSKTYGELEIDEKTYQQKLKEDDDLMILLEWIQGQFRKKDKRAIKKIGMLLMANPKVEYSLAKEIVNQYSSKNVGYVYECLQSAILEGMTTKEEYIHQKIEQFEAKTFMTMFEKYRKDYNKKK